MSELDHEIVAILATKILIHECQPDVSVLSVAQPLVREAVVKAYEITRAAQELCDAESDEEE